MVSISRYFLSIITAVILCGIFTSITEKSTYSKVIRLLTGIIVMLSVFKPLTSVSDMDLDFQQIAIEDEADSVISKGRDVAAQQMDNVISERVCAYIEDKAAVFGAEITATVMLQKHIPSEATIRGKIAPYVKTQLAAWITSELGIPKEAQNWK